MFITVAHTCTLTSLSRFFGYYLRLLHTAMLLVGHIQFCYITKLNMTDQKALRCVATLFFKERKNVKYM